MPHAVKFRALLNQTLGSDDHVKGWRESLPILNKLLLGGESPDSLLKELAESKEVSSDSLVVLQKCCLQLCLESQDFECRLPELVSCVEGMQKTGDLRWNQWIADLAFFQRSIQSAKSMASHAGWTIGIATHPKDLFLLGEQTRGCQSIHGDPHYSKCLLAYVVDEKNATIAIKDICGVIKKRAILRLLFDQKNRRPGAVFGEALSFLWR